MFSAGIITKVSGLSYRQVDNLVRNHGLRPSHMPARGRGTVRGFTERDAVAFMIAKKIIDAGHRLEPLLSALRYIQRSRTMPSLTKLEGKTIVCRGALVQLIDGRKTKLSTAAAMDVAYVIDLGAAAKHVRRGIERL